MASLRNIRTRLAGGDASASASSRAAGKTADGALPCQIIVGLGNPGTRYTTTRHNAGFLAVEALASRLGITSWRARFDSLVAEKNVMLAGEKTLVVLAKPQTMMNCSGRAVKGLLKHYQVGLESLVVVHDDIDLPPGTLRIKEGGGHGGHNGMRDIIATVGADFARIKIGVGSPPGRMDSADYVLQPLKKESLEEFEVDAAKAAEVAEYLLGHTLIEAQNQFN